MKKIFLTIALVFGLMTVSFGHDFGRTDGFFADGGYSERTGETVPQLPTTYGNGNDMDAPLGSGLLILTALGAGYTLMRKKEHK